MSRRRRWQPVHDPQHGAACGWMGNGSLPALPSRWINFCALLLWLSLCLFGFKGFGEQLHKSGIVTASMHTLQSFRTYFISNPWKTLKLIFPWTI